jgi:hypothetical protein
VAGVGAGLNARTLGEAATIIVEPESINCPS